MPFLFSIVLVGIGLFIRIHISETPAFQRVLTEEVPASIPVVEAVRDYTANVVFGIGAKIAESGLFNIYAVFVITYCVTKLGLPKQIILNGVLVGCALECLTLPLFGALSDRIGRKPVRMGGMIFQALLAILFFMLINTGNTGLIWLAIVLGLAIGHGSVYGAQGAYFSRAVSGPGPLQRALAGAADRADPGRRPVTPDRDASAGGVRQLGLRSRSTWPRWRSCPRSA